MSKMNSYFSLPLTSIPTKPVLHLVFSTFIAKDPNQSISILSWKENQTSDSPVITTWSGPARITSHPASTFHPISSVQFSSFNQSCRTLCDPMDHSTPGFPDHHQLLELSQTHVHHVGDAIQPSHPLLSPSSPAFNLFQHQCLFQWISSSHQEAKVLELQLQHQSFQWIFRTDFL